MLIVSRVESERVIATLNVAVVVRVGIVNYERAQQTIKISNSTKYADKTSIQKIPRTSYSLPHRVS